MTAFFSLPINSNNQPTRPRENRFAVSGWILLFHLFMLGALMMVPAGHRAEKEQPPVPAPMVLVELQTPPIPLSAGQTTALPDSSVTAASPVAKLTSPQPEGAISPVQAHSPAKPMPLVSKPEKVATQTPSSVSNSSSASNRMSDATSNSTTALTAPEAGASGAHASGDNDAKASRSVASAAPTSTTTGNEYSAPQFGAGYLSNPAPDYPATARRMGEEGKVLLHVLVTADGGAKQVKLHRTSGSESLDAAALKAVRKWRFVPAKRGDQALEAWVYVPIVFKLD
jgi:protein TonB